MTMGDGSMPKKDFDPKSKENSHEARKSNIVKKTFEIPTLSGIFVQIPMVKKCRQAYMTGCWCDHI
jgi:hypothetical protein